MILLSDLFPFSDENGLYLVLGSVQPDGPAYESGLRSGDVIVTVSDWLITVMDRPQVKLSQAPTGSHLSPHLTAQVALHLFQAGANIVRLGILKPNGTSHDIISYVQGQNHDRNIIGVF